MGRTVIRGENAVRGERSPGRTQSGENAVWGERSLGRTQSGENAVMNGFHNLRMGVAKNERSPGGDIIDELVAIDIVDPDSAGLFNKYGIAADGLEGADGTVDAAGNHFLSGLKQFFRFGSFHN